MKASSRIGVLAGAFLSTTVLLACSSAATTTGDGGGSNALASVLSGKFRGTTPGNGLLLDISTIGARAGGRFDFFVTASGRYRDSNARRAGLLRLETQGRDVRATYVPKFDTTVTPLSRDATRFTEDELSAACTFDFHPNGDGFAAEVPGSACARAIPGAVGKWTIEVDPAGIRIRNAESGETLRFAKAA